MDKTQGQQISTAVARWSQPFQDVMEAGLINEGQRVFLEYGPRGKPKQTFEGILRKEGVEIEGKVMSLSAAAVYCIKKAGSQRETANGWIMWKTEDGTYLSEFYNKVYSKENYDQDTENLQQPDHSDNNQHKGMAWPKAQAVDSSYVWSLKFKKVINTFF